MSMKYLSLTLSAVVSVIHLLTYAHPVEAQLRRPVVVRGGGGCDTVEACRSSLDEARADLEKVRVEVDVWRAKKQAAREAMKACNTRDTVACSRAVVADDRVSREESDLRSKLSLAELRLENTERQAAKTAAAAAAKSDITALREVWSWQLCMNQRAVNIISEEMAQERLVERESGVADLRARRALGVDMAASKANVENAKRALAENDLPPIPCDQIPADTSALSAHAQTLLSNTR